MKKQDKVYYLNLLEMVTLLANLHIAAKDNDIGHGDSGRPLTKLSRSISERASRFPVSQDHLESCLWACNMLNEKGKFWQPWINPKTMPFKKFLEGILEPGEKFDKFYGNIRRSK